MPDSQEPDSQVAPKGRSQKDIDKFLDLAHRRFTESADMTASWRKEALDDTKFSVGKIGDVSTQWEPALLNRRQEEGKPSLTMNRMPQHLRLVGNEYRQQRPAVKVNPVGSGADKETADVLEGVIRHIETASDAEVADDTAFEWMLRCGMGVERLVTEFIDEETFDQEIKIVREDNPLCWYFDPYAQDPLGSDGKYAFKIIDMEPGRYKEKYPDSDLASLEDFTSLGDAKRDWANSQNVRIAEYFYVEEEYKTVKHDSGRTREVTKRKVKWALINAMEILEERDWPGKFIPVIPFLGEYLIIDGKVYLAGLVRNAKEPQRAYNYQVSCATESAGLAPKAPFVADFRTIEQFREQWEAANRRNLAVLPYDSQPAGYEGEPLPAPQRNSVEPPLQAHAYLVRQADLDLKASLGMFDPTLGQNKSDQSGKAIMSLQKQGDIATLNFSDNAARSIRYRGRVKIDLIPKVYDAPRIQRIVNPDGSVKHVGTFNSAATNYTKDDVQNIPEFAEAMQNQQNPLKKIYDIGVGRYDVTVSVGPSFQTKRQEAVATQLDLAKNVPIVAQGAPDLIIRNMDIPGADEIADRVKKLLPPQLQDSDNPDDPQTLKAQLAALTMQHQQVTQALQEATMTIATKRVEQESKERIAAADNQTQIQLKLIDERVKLATAEIETKAQEASERQAALQGLLQMHHDSAHELGLEAMKQKHEKDMAERSATLAAAQPQEQPQTAAQ